MRSIIVLLLWFIISINSLRILNGRQGSRLYNLLMAHHHLFGMRREKKFWVLTGAVIVFLTFHNVSKIGKRMIDRFEIHYHHCKLLLLFLTQLSYISYWRTNENTICDRWKLLGILQAGIEQQWNSFGKDPDGLARLQNWTRASRELHHVVLGQWQSTSTVLFPFTLGRIRQTLGNSVEATKCVVGMSCCPMRRGWRWVYCERR